MGFLGVLSRIVLHSVWALLGYTKPFAFWRLASCSISHLWNLLLKESRNSLAGNARKHVCSFFSALRLFLPIFFPWHGLLVLFSQFLAMLLLAHLLDCSSSNFLG